LQTALLHVDLFPDPYENEVWTLPEQRT
jgi:hypothetical protein